jgi:hypothetical protein
MSQVTANTTAPATVKTPAIHLLPLNLGRLAKHADKKGYAGRFITAGVRVAFPTTGSYLAEATDTKQLVRVEGPVVADPNDYPHESIPGLSTAPNGATAAVVPLAAWEKAFAQANKLGNLKRLNNALGSVACVVGNNVTTFGATDTESRMVEQTPNLEGRYVDGDFIIEKTEKDAPIATFTVDAKMLLELLKTAAAFAEDDDNNRVDIEVRGTHKPIIIRSMNSKGQKFTGLQMPLTD